MTTSTAKKIDRINDRIMEIAPHVIGAYILLVVAFIGYGLFTGMSTIAISAVLLPAVMIPTGLGIAMVIASMLVNNATAKVLGHR